MLHLCKWVTGFPRARSTSTTLLTLTTLRVVTSLTPSTKGLSNPRHGMAMLHHRITGNLLAAISKTLSTKPKRLRKVGESARTPLPQEVATQEGSLRETPSCNNPISSNSLCNKAIGIALVVKATLVEVVALPLGTRSRSKRPMTISFRVVQDRYIVLSVCSDFYVL